MRIVLAVLLVLLLLQPASAESSFVVPVPGTGRVEVLLFPGHLAPEGVFVLQGVDGPDKPCTWFPGMLRCIVAAGPLTSITYYYTALPPTCTDRAHVRVRIANRDAPTLIDATPGPRCVWLPMTGRS